MSFPKEHLESLWSPWRVEYFQRDRTHEEDFFAEAARATDDAAALVVSRNKNAFLMLNKYPYASGHMMSVPYRRTAFMEALSPDEVLDVWILPSMPSDSSGKPARPRDSMSASILEPQVEPAIRIISISTSSPAGPATTTSCRCWPAYALFPRDCNRSMTG